MELNEQTLEQILSRQREGYQRHLEEFRHHIDQVEEKTRLHMGVLIEDVKSDIKLLAEGIPGLQQHRKSELAIIRRDLKEKVGRDELAALEARVAKLERSPRTR